jgi:Holliday junction DNA helicase RuvA
MRDRLKDWQTNPDSQMADIVDSGSQPSKPLVSHAKGDATNALVSLGYSQPQADKAIKLVFSADATSETLIRDALKAML